MQEIVNGQQNSKKFSVTQHMLRDKNIIIKVKYLIKRHEEGCSYSDKNKQQMKTNCKWKEVSMLSCFVLQLYLKII